MYERLGVYRSGKLHHISGPGIVVVIPFLEKSKKINLIESIPNLRSLTQDALDEKLLEILSLNGEVEIQKDYYKEFFSSILEKTKIIFTPEFDLGIKNVRLRGLVRLVIGTIFPVLLSLLVIGGNWLYDTFDLAPVNPEPENIDIFFGFLIFIPWLLSIFFSIHIIWGMVEVIANRTWAEIPKSIRWIMLIILGIPTYGMICYLTYITVQSF